MHDLFTGDFNLANTAVGEVPGHKSRMGSPYLNWSAFAYWYRVDLENLDSMPFSCGDRHEECSSKIGDETKRSLIKWISETDASSCQAIAVQHILNYHADRMKYRMMIRSHGH